jgi:hypothetical protein
MGKYVAIHANLAAYYLLLLIESPPRRRAIFFLFYIPLCIIESPPRRRAIFFCFIYLYVLLNGNIVRPLGATPQQWFKKRFREKKKFFYTVTFVAGCVHLFSPKPPAFSKKKSTTCSTLFFQFPAGTLISLVVFVCTPFRSRVQQLLLSLSYLSSCLSFTNRCATNPSVYFVCLFLVFRDLFVFTQFTQCSAKCVYSFIFLSYKF